VSVDFLARASREYTRGGWIFTGFHWPVLAGETAARLTPDVFGQIFEAGATTHGRAEAMPTSTTDYAAFGGAFDWCGTSSTVFAGMVRRADRVVLDAANVDLRGCVNSTAIGPYARPDVRLPGGGGAADAAGGAGELVLLHGAETPERIVARVEHVTGRPRPGVPTRLVTRWGVLRLDGAAPRQADVDADAPGVERPEPPRLVEVDEGAPGIEGALAHFAALGVETADAAPWPEPTPAEREAAAEVLELAAARGYVVARRALAKAGA
jgi:glutaconate CoA-transferase subunit B